MDNRRDFIKKAAASSAGLIIGGAAFGFSAKSYNNIIGPYFGNGFHNGWADQTSIVIWTRLTKMQEMNKNGQKFLEISVEEAEKLDKSADKEKIFKAQIPNGFSLEQMEGACPGASGEVKLVYFPVQRSTEKIETKWISVETAKNFTRQWKLENLTPGTKYVVELFARATSVSEISDSIKGFFRTPPSSDVSGDLDFCIVSCHDYWRRDDAKGHKIYNAIPRNCPVVHPRICIVF